MNSQLSDAAAQENDQGRRGPITDKGLEGAINFKYESSVSSIAKAISNIISNFGSSINTNEEQILEATIGEVEFEELGPNVMVEKLELFHTKIRRNYLWHLKSNSYLPVTIVILNILLLFHIIQ
jgi:hypothetical protein